MVPYGASHADVQLQFGAKHIHEGLGGQSVNFYLNTFNDIDFVRFYVL